SQSEAEPESTWQTLPKAVCHSESDKCRFGNPPQESNFQRLGIIRELGKPKSEAVDLHALVRDVARIKESLPG
ncbi:MAG: hypothetical protein WA231_21290, partial [Methylocella sp.]